MKMKCGHDSDNYQTTLDKKSVPVCLECNCYDLYINKEHNKDKREGYNTNMFKIKCLNCGSYNCSILDSEMNDSEDNAIGYTTYIFCNNCSKNDI